MKSRGYEQFVQIDDFTFDSRDLWMVEELMLIFKRSYHNDFLKEDN